jgi:hypothetical protein
LEGFASKAWIMKVDVEGELREYCVDSSIPPLLSREWRALTLVYPKGSCSTAIPRGLRLLESTLGAEELFNKLVEACFKAVEEWERLRALRKPILSLLLRRRPDSVEEELYEVGNAVELCKLIFGDKLEPRLEAYSRAYIAYVRGSRGYERIRALARVDEGARRLLENL